MESTGKLLPVDAPHRVPSGSADALFQRFYARFAASPWRLIAAGFSGGLDSTVLLHLLLRCARHIPISLQAFHVHHGLSPHAEVWREHCARVCAQWQVDFSSARVAVCPQPGESLEACARQARQSAFARLKVDAVALAHHQDDQAETVLYRLLRGAGTPGAAAMRPLREARGGPALWRPLLDEPRKVLLEYARQQGLVWIEDESNASLDFDRNFLRAEIFPRLTTRFPGARATLARAAKRFAEATELLDDLARQDAAASVDAAASGDIGEAGVAFSCASDSQLSTGLPLAVLAPLSRLRQMNVLRWFLTQRGLRLSEAQLQTVLQQMQTALPDRQPVFQLAGQEIRRYRNHLFVLSPCAPPPVARLVWQDGADSWPEGWPGHMVWRQQAGGIAPGWLEGLALRCRVGGETLRPRPAGPTRLVKHLFQEADIPPWQRSCWPLLWWENRLVAVAGLAVEADFQAPATSGFWPEWVPD